MGDIDRLQQVALKVWEFTYGGIYTPASIRQQVAEYYATERLRAEIGQARRKESFFQAAFDSGELVGYLNGGRVRRQEPRSTEPRNNLHWELYRIYLLPEYIGRGIGKEMLHHWDEFLRERKADRYCVYIEPKNKLGNDFYLRNGFVRAKELDRGAASPCLVKTL